MCRRSMIFIIQNEKILNCFPNYDINLGESFFFFFFNFFSIYLDQPCFYSLSPAHRAFILSAQRRWEMFDESRFS